MIFGVVLDSTREVLLYNNELKPLDFTIKANADVTSVCGSLLENTYVSTQDLVYKIDEFGFCLPVFESIDIAYISLVKNNLVVIDNSRGSVYEVLPNDEKIIHIGLSGMNNYDNITSCFYDKEEDKIYYTYTGSNDIVGKVVREDGFIVCDDLYKPYNYQKRCEGKDFWCEYDLQAITIRGHNNITNIVVEGNPRGIFVHNNLLYVGEYQPTRVSIYNLETLSKVDELNLPVDKQILDMRILYE